MNFKDYFINEATEPGQQVDYEYDFKKVDNDIEGDIEIHTPLKFKSNIKLGLDEGRIILKRISKSTSGKEPATFWRYCENSDKDNMTKIFVDISREYFNGAFYNPPIGGWVSEIVNVLNSANIILKTKKLQEDYHNTFKISGQDIEIFKNPSMYEPDEFTNEIRGILTVKGDLIVWSGNTTIMHISVAKRLNINLSDLRNLALFIYKDRNLINISFYDTEGKFKKISDKEIERLKNVVKTNKNIQKYMLEDFKVGTENLVRQKEEKIKEAVEPGQGIEITDKYFSVSTPTYDKWMAVQKWANKNGILWAGGQDYLDNYSWNQYKNKSVIDITKYNSRKVMMYGEYEQQKLYTFEEFKESFL